MQMLWIVLYPVLLAPLMRWSFAHYRPYAAPLIMQGVGLVQTLIAGLLVSFAALAYARRIAPGLAHDQRARPATPAAQSAAVMVGWAWMVLQLQLMRPAYGLFGAGIMREHPWIMLAVVALPLLPAIIVWLAAARPLADLQPWHAAPGRAVLAALCAFIVAQVAQGAAAFALMYGLGLSVLARGGMLAVMLVSLLVYLALLVPLTRLFVRLFYRREGGGAAPAAA